MRYAKAARKPAHVTAARVSRAVSPPNNLAALQAMADGSLPVRQMEALSGIATEGPLQLKKPDVYDKAAFENPETYLGKTAANSQIVEDGGSAGLSSAIYRNEARYLADPGNRATVLDGWYNKADPIANNAQASPEEKKQAQKIYEAATALKKVKDFETAALFLRENSLAMSQGGIGMEQVHQDPKVHDGKHTFHRDSGMVKVDPGRLSGGKNQTPGKAKALNGPTGSGWVQGHAEIDNYHHRFVEHVHVDKDSAENRFEIYNGAKSAVDAAGKWGAELKKVEGRLTGEDLKAIQEAEAGKKDQDLENAKTWNAKQ